MMARANPEDLVAPHKVVTEIMIKRDTAAMTLRLIGARADGRSFDETVVIGENTADTLVKVIQECKVELEVACRTRGLKSL